MKLALYLERLAEFFLHFGAFLLPLGTVSIELSAQIETRTHLKKGGISRMPTQCAMYKELALTA